MNASSLLLLAISSVALSPFVVSGCGSGSAEVSTVVVPTEPLSTLTLRWSVAGSFDPNACVLAFADRIDISIVEPGTGGELAAYQQSCETFATSITLSPGTYAALARLVDTAGQARTTDVVVPTFTVFGNDELIQDIDFPAESFFAGHPAP